MGSLFRRARLEDARALDELVDLLGPPVPPGFLAERLQRLLAADHQAVFVAEESGAVRGFTQVEEFLSLTSDPCALLVGLAVAPAARGRGIGRGLVQCAEQWARERGLGTIRLRARVARRGAHAFYERLGYVRRKHQLQFGKSLTA